MVVAVGEARHRRVTGEIDDFRVAADVCRYVAIRADEDNFAAIDGNPFGLRQIRTCGVDGAVSDNYFRRTDPAAAGGEKDAERNQ